MPDDLLLLPAAERPANELQLLHAGLLPDLPALPAALQVQAAHHRGTNTRKSPSAPLSWDGEPWAGVQMLAAGMHVLE